MGPSPSQERVLFCLAKHKPPKPVVTGSKPVGPVFIIYLSSLDLFSGCIIGLNSTLSYAECSRYVEILAADEI